MITACRGLLSRRPKLYAVRNTAAVIVRAMPYWRAPSHLPFVVFEKLSFFDCMLSIMWSFSHYITKTLKVNAILHISPFSVY